MGRRDRSDEARLMEAVKSTSRAAEAIRHAPPVVEVGNSRLDPFCDELLHDKIYQRELAMLRTAARLNVTPALDIRDVLPDPVTHEVLLAWQESSEDRLRDEKGRDDLLRRRRHYILRMDDLLPIDLPLIHSLPTEALEREYRYYALKDEKEYLAISFKAIVHAATDVKPTLPVFRHTHARAILDWKAQTLDFWLSACPQFLGGYISHDFSDDVRAVLDERAARRGRPISKPRFHTNEVKFDSWRFWLWYVSQMN